MKRRVDDVEYHRLFINNPENYEDKTLYQFKVPEDTYNLREELLEFLSESEDNEDPNLIEIRDTLKKIDEEIFNGIDGSSKIMLDGRQVTKVIDPEQYDIE